MADPMMVHQAVGAFEIPVEDAVNYINLGVIKSDRNGKLYVDQMALQAYQTGGPNQGGGMGYQPQGQGGGGFVEGLMAGMYGGEKAGTGLSSLWGGGSTAAKAAPVAEKAAELPFAGMSSAELGTDFANANIEGGLPWYAANPSTYAGQLGEGISNTLYADLGVAPETAGGIGQFLGSAIPAAATAVGAYSLYNNLTDEEADPLGGALAGAGMGGGAYALLATQPELWPFLAITGGSALLGGGLGLIKGKNKDRIERDSWRDQLKEGQWMGMGDDLKVRFSDGGEMNLGEEGWRDVGGKKGMPFDMPDDEESRQIRGMAQPLAHILIGGSDDRSAKRVQDLGGYMGNAAKQGNARQRLQELYAGSGLDHDTAYGEVWNRYNAGEIDDKTRNAYLAAVDKLYGVVNPNQGKGGTAEFGAAYIPGSEQQQQQQPISNPNMIPKVEQALAGKPAPKGLLKLPADFKERLNKAGIIGK